MLNISSATQNFSFFNLSFVSCLLACYNDNTYPPKCVAHPQLHTPIWKYNVVSGLAIVLHIGHVESLEDPQQNTNQLHPLGLVEELSFEGAHG